MTLRTAGATRPRTVVVDDSTHIRLGMALLHPELEVVGAWDTVEPVLGLGPTAADLVVLDLKLRRTDEPTGPRQGVAAIEAVRATGIPICLFTDEHRRTVLAQCLRAGALGIVHKSDPVPEATSGFLAVARGEPHLTPSLVGLAELTDRRGGLPELTDRQRQVLAARARGESWSSIAHRLYITEGVAREHLRTVSLKFQHFLRARTPGDIELALGMAPGDLLAPVPPPTDGEARPASWG